MKDRLQRYHNLKLAKKRMWYASRDPELWSHFAWQEVKAFCRENVEKYELNEDYREISVHLFGGWEFHHGELVWSINGGTLIARGVVLNGYRPNDFDQLSIMANSFSSTFMSNNIEIDRMARQVVYMARMDVGHAMLDQDALMNLFVAHKVRMEEFQETFDGFENDGGDAHDHILGHWLRPIE